MASALSTSERGGLRSALSRFFYEPEVPFGVALVRMTLPIGILLPMVIRWSHARELYSADGAPAPLALTYGYPGFLPELPGTVVVAMHSVLILALVAALVGWCTRWSLLTATVLYTYINMHDSLSTMTKYSVIATHGLLLMSLSNCGAVWSVDAWLAKRRRQRAGLPLASCGPPTFAPWPRRLIQLFIGIVYLGAAMTKIHTPAFFSGEQLQTWMITNYNIRTPLGLYLSQFPSILVMMGYITIVWEFLFVFLSYRGWGRIAMLGTGATFHILTGFSLGLDVFPVICISLYFAFVEERDIVRLSAAWKRSRMSVAWNRVTTRLAVALDSAPRWPESWRIPTTAAFVLTAIAVAFVGVEAEYLSDPYGERRPEGAYTLKELDPQYAAELLTPSPMIRDKDKFTFLETGTVYVGGHLLNRRTQFQSGERVMVEYGVAPPHEDMWIECNLHDNDNRVIDTVGAVVTREMMSNGVYYDLTDWLAPGQYWLVLKTGGKEVMRKPIQIRARDGVKSAMAN